MSTINPLTVVTPVAQTAVHVATPEERVQDLRIDQIVRATVAEGGEGKARLDIGQRRLMAETGLQLKTGQKLDLMVVATSPRIELRIVEDALAQRLGHSIYLLGGKWEFLPPVSHLMSGLLDSLSPQAREAFESWMALQAGFSSSPDGKALRRLAQRMGLDLEAKLAKGEGEEAGSTLKSALLEVAQDPDGEEHVGRSLKNLELLQLCQAKLTQQGIQLVPLPLPFFDQAFLTAEEGEAKEDGEKPPPKVSLHLSLQGLGDLRIDFLNEPDGLLLRFACDSSEKADFVSGFREELDRALDSFPLRGASFAGGAESPAKSLIEKILPQGCGVLDTRV